MIALRRLFFTDLIREARNGPDLAVRMGIARPHHLPAILEDLDIIDKRQTTDLPILFRPGADDLEQFRLFHPRESEVMARRETDDAAQTRLALSDDQSVIIDQPAGRRLTAQGGEIVLEDEDPGVIRVGGAAGARVCRAEITIRVIGGAVNGGDLLDLPLSGSL